MQQDIAVLQVRHAGQGGVHALCSWTVGLGREGGLPCPLREAAGHLMELVDAVLQV
jgi:hypothetical protein